MFWKEWKMREKMACKSEANCLTFPPCLNLLCLIFVQLSSDHLKLAEPFSFHAHCRPKSFGFWFSVKSGDTFMVHVPVHEKLNCVPWEMIADSVIAIRELLGELEKMSLAEDVQDGCLAYSCSLELYKFLLPIPAQTYWSAWL